MNEVLKVKIELLKDVPGVYIMKDIDSKVIYVGKAKSLIKRVKQYFYRPQAGKVARMVREITDFETIQINSEKEALLLELNLIRKYYPKYNILLKDGKGYPFIALSKDKYPSLKIVYKKDKPKDYYYFGPYPLTNACYKVIDLLNKIFPLRKCNVIPSSPCLYYHLNQCLGPCINKDLALQYDEMRKDIISFMLKKDKKIENKLKLEMNEASKELNFEKAQDLFETIKSIEYVQEQQSIIFSNNKNFDVIATSSREGYFSLCVMTYRGGTLLGKKVFVDEEEDDIISQIQSLVFQYYQNNDQPRTIIVGNPSLQDSLQEVIDSKIIVPSRGEKKELLLTGLENAKNGLDAHFLSSRLNDNVLELLERLGNILKIKTPLRIELFDNSHLQGADPVGAMVVFINGVKAPSMYRKFNISFSDGKDDLKSMYEVILRRYSRLVKEGQSLPDLIIVDGGRTQMEVAKKALEDANVEIPLCGLSKDNNHHTSMLIDQDYNPHKFEKDDKLFLLLVRMQDEVHRYAITFHRFKRNKALTKSFFDDIPGIGDKRKEYLIKAYKSLEDIKNASDAELEQILPKNVIKALKDKLNLEIEKKS